MIPFLPTKKYFHLCVLRALSEAGGDIATIVESWQTRKSLLF
jgi:hypothetical protein